MRRFFWVLHLLFFIVSCGIFALTHWVLSAHWAAGFLMLSTPFLVAIHGFLLIFWLIFNKQKAWLSGLALLLSTLFWPRMFGFHQESPTIDKTDLTVMSYNVRCFDVYNYLDGIDPGTGPNMVIWSKSTNADVVCFQECYNLATRPKFDVIRQFKQQGYLYHTTLHPEHAPNEEHFFGLCIFSKFPIKNVGEQTFVARNGVLYADIEVNKKTIRVINVHLYSMSLAFDKAKTAYRTQDKELLKTEAKGIGKRLKTGFVQRTEEWKYIDEFMTQSPYPVLLCGDFNETPFGYVYGKIRQRLHNAFEDAGAGFGFSYRDTPKFIRIDNQFYDPNGLEVLDFDTRTDVRYSDHFPVIGRYKIL